MEQLNLFTTDGAIHNLSLTKEARIDLERHLSAALYDADGRRVPHPTAEIVIHNASGQEIFRRKAADILPCITRS